MSSGSRSRVALLLINAIQLRNFYLEKILIKYSVGLWGIQANPNGMLMRTLRCVYTFPTVNFYSMTHYKEEKKNGRNFLTFITIKYLHKSLKSSW